MIRILEAIFRHPLQLLLLIILPPIIAVAVAYIMTPRTYQSTASVWALQRYFDIGATGPESNFAAYPAQTQATALGELLQTRAFALAVAQKVDLAPTLGLSKSVMNDPRQLQDALYSDISKHVVVAPSVYNLYYISYTNHDPQIAQQVVKAVITVFGSQGLGLSVLRGQNLLVSYQTQLVNVQKDASNAVKAEAQYVATNPNVQQMNNPEYANLDLKRIQAEAAVQNIQDIINTLQQSISTQGTDTNNLFKVIDAPLTGIPLSRSKDYLVGGGVGLGIALLACTIYLVILVRRDRAIHSAYDLQNSSAFPVIMQLPKLSPTSITLLTTSTIHD